MDRGRLLVTGAAGFVGARLVDTLSRQKLHVISVDSLPLFTNRPEHREIDFGERIAPEILLDWLTQQNPPLGAIFHLGACTDTTEMDEAYLTRVNLDYSKALWDYCTWAKIPFLYASSAATYGDGAEGYSDDESRLANLRPLNPYGESKHNFDLWALEQERDGKRPPAWSAFKFFNVYGFGERHKGKMASVVLQAFDQIQTSGRLKLFRSHREGIAHGEQRRDFISVEDVVDVLQFALDRHVPRGIFNLGTGTARTFLDLGNITFASLAKRPQIDFIDTPEALRERYQYFTEAKMEKLRAAGYRAPFRTLEQGIGSYIGQLLKQ